MKRHDPEGLRLPTKITSTSSSEFEPIPLEKRNRVANKIALENATENARCLGVSRRKFMVSAAGVASALLAFNKVNLSAGKTGGFFDIDAEAAVDEAAAKLAVEGKEFIFDVHGHFVNPTGAWLEKVPSGSAPFFANPRYSAEHFIQDVFMDSDTDMMVLTFVPSMPDAEPLTIEEAAATREIIDQMDGTARLLLHGRVAPNIPEDIARMKSLKQDYDVAAWKSYTQWAPSGNAYASLSTGGGYSFLDEETGIRFVEEAIATGVKNIAVHKGLPFGRGDSYKYARCDDIGAIAARYPEVNFLVYHSGYDPAHPEGPYTEGGEQYGVDSLVESLKDYGIEPNSNVYADLGATWNIWRRDMDQAAHGFGKLLRYVGVNNVLWGTDAIWWGSPQDQIQAFRTFQISKEWQDRYGYFEITPEIRAKVFGLNATKPYGIDEAEVTMRASRDKVAKRRVAYREDPDPHFLTYGPKTRREFLNLQSWKRTTGHWT